MFFKSKGAVDYLVVGLGNPGVKYENTRHNAGYMAVDKIAEKYNCKFEKSKFKGEIAKCSISGKKVSLDVGRMRIRRQGSDGGHNGIKNILMYFNENFARIKIGVGKKPHPDYDLAAWVLSKFSKDEQKSLQTVTENTVSAAELIIKGEIDTAMNKFNS